MNPLRKSTLLDASDFADFNVIPFAPFFAHRKMTRTEGMAFVTLVSENCPDLISVSRFENGVFVFKTLSDDYIFEALRPWADLAYFAFEADVADGTIYAGVFMHDGTADCYELGVLNSAKAAASITDLNTLLNAALALVPTPHNPAYRWEVEGRYIELRGPTKRHDNGLAGAFSCSMDPTGDVIEMTWVDDDCEPTTVTIPATPAAIATEICDIQIQDAF